jgi:transposase, IS5 family
MGRKDPLTALKIETQRDEISHYCDFGTRVIEQARRRVLDGEQVPTSGKIYSIFRAAHRSHQARQGGHAG